MFYQRRIVMLAQPRFGYLSPSRKALEALEKAGHLVYWFTPKTFPQLFEDGVADLSPLRALIARWDVDAVVATDGIALDASTVAPGVARVVLAQTRRELERSLAGGAPDCVWLLPGIDARGLLDGNLPVRVLEAPVDATTRFPANTIVFPPAIVCAQEATEGRVEALRALEGSVCADRKLPVRCLGSGWPDEWIFNRTPADALYACAAGGLMVTFPDEQDASDAALGAYFGSAFEQLSGEGGAIIEIAGSDVAGLPAQAEAALAGLGEPSVRRPGENPFATSVLIALEATCGEARAGAGAGGDQDAPLAPGRTSACRLVTVFGYVGKGNFGDEYLLSTVATRVAERVDGAVCVAVSEDPWHTLVHHGVYAISLEDKLALDELLARSSAALVIGGLLFDQGVRWTMGKAELVSSVLHSDLPGIAAYAALARLNDVPVVYYGIGGGPLELAHSRRLVRLMGELGGLFLCRDEKTARLVLASGVPEEQVRQRADVAFTGAARAGSGAEAWLRREGISEEGGFVAISLREYEGLPRDFPARVAHACDRLLDAHEGLHAVFCLLDADDEGISQDVIAQMRHGERAHLFSYADDVTAMGALLGRAAAGLSMRYHCSLLLFKAGTPCVGLCYLPKVRSLYGEAGMGAFLLPVDADERALEEAVTTLYDRREALSDVVRKGTEGLLSLARAAEDELIRIVSASDPAMRHVGRQDEVYLFELSFSDRELRDARAECRDVKLWNERLEGWLADANAQLADARAQLADAPARIAELESELAEARGRVEALENSNSYKVGSLLLRVPGKVKRLLRG